MKSQTALWVFTSVLSCGACRVPLITEDSIESRLTAEEAAIKMSGQWPVPIEDVEALELRTPTVLTNVLAPTGLAPDGADTLVLDSATAMLSRITQQGAINKTTTSLYYPTIFKTSGGAMFAADRSGIHKLAESGESTGAVQSFFSINDFVALPDGSFLISPLFRFEGGPLVMRIDRDGTAREEWGRGPTDSSGAALLTGQGLITLCAGHIVVVGRYEPEVKLFSLNGTAQGTWPIPIRGADRLAELRRAPLETVRPAPGRYILPTFVEGVACQRETTYVLLALEDRLAVATFGEDGTPKVLEAQFAAGVQKRLSNLVVRESSNGMAEFGVLGFDRSTENWELLRATRKKDTSTSQGRSN